MFNLLLTLLGIVILTIVVGKLIIGLIFSSRADHEANLISKRAEYEARQLQSGERVYRNSSIVNAHNLPRR